MAYLNQVNLKNIDVMGSDEVRDLVTKIGRVSQCGIRYYEDMVIFTTHTEGDMDDAIGHDAWQHTRMSHRIKEGTKVIVIPNKNVRNKMSALWAIVGVATDKMFRVNEELTWTSNGHVTSTKSSVPAKKDKKDKKVVASVKRKLRRGLGSY